MSTKDEKVTKVVEAKVADAKAAETKAETKEEAKASAKEPAKRGRKPGSKNKTTSKKPEVKREIFVEHNGNQVSEEEIIAKVRKDFKERKIEVKEVKLYIKPEDNACYYVVNDTIHGQVSLY